jgi:hypothetical protein
VFKRSSYICHYLCIYVIQILFAGINNFSVISWFKSDNVGYRLRISMDFRP